MIFLVIFTKAIHILMLYLGFWHATIKRIHNFSKDLLRSQKIGSQKSCEISKKCYGSQKNNWISKYLTRSQKILWDLKNSLRPHIDTCSNFKNLTLLIMLILLTLLTMLTLLTLLTTLTLLMLLMLLTLHTLSIDIVVLIWNTNLDGFRGYVQSQKP